jgi:hypothetical protein
MLRHGSNASSMDTTSQCDADTEDPLAGCTGDVVPHSAAASRASSARKPMTGESHSTRQSAAPVGLALLSMDPSSKHVAATCTKKCTFRSLNGEHMLHAI